MAADQDEAKAGPRARPSVTIDLTAENVGASAASIKPETPRADAPKPETAREPRSAGRRASDSAAPGADAWRQNAFAGVIGGVVALVILTLLQAVGLLPAPGRSAANQATEQAKAASESVAGLDRRLTAVEAMTEGIPALRTDLTSVSGKMASLDAVRNTIATHADVDGVATSVAALGKRVDALPPPAVTAEDVAAVTERLSRLEVAVAAGGNASGDSTAAIGSLAAQLADAQAEVKALGERVAAAESRTASVATGASEAATRGLAVASLRRAAGSATPFAADVDMVAALGVAGDDIAALRPLAAKGIADAAALAADFPAVADAILTVTAANDPNANFFQRLLGSLVTIRPAGPVAGNDPPAIVSRMKDDVAKGDLAAALTERDALPQSGKDASADWAAKAADRVALDALVEKIARTLDPPKAG